MNRRLKAVAGSEPHHRTREGIYLVIMAAERESLYLIQEGSNPRPSEKADVAYLCLAADWAGSLQLAACGSLASHGVLRENSGHIVINGVHAGRSRLLLYDYLCGSAVHRCCLRDPPLDLGRGPTHPLHVDHIEEAV